MGDQRKIGYRLLLSKMQNPKPEILTLPQRRWQPRVDCMKGCITMLRPYLMEAEIIFLGTISMLPEAPSSWSNSV